MRAPVGPPGRCPLPEPPPRSFRRRIRDPSGYHAAMGRQTARVRVAAPLRFLLPAQHRHGEVMVPVDAASSLSHLVESLGVPRTEVGELRVNGRTVLPAARPGDGDLVEVLPVPRPQRIDDPRFVLDVHLGTLRSYHRFFRCRACGRPYWRGAHAGRLNAIVANALRGREGG